MALPREPRQKMINIMYLVLTAILALNVSNEVINAFRVVNNSLETTNGNIKSANANLYTALAEKLNDPLSAERAKKWEPLAERARVLSENMDAYLDSLKLELKKAAGLTKIYNSTVKDSVEEYKEENLDASTRMFETGGEGDRLRARLEGYKEQILAIDPAVKSRFEKNFPVSTAVPRSLEGHIKDFTQTYFHMTPAIAALTMLSKFQNNIKNVENSVVTFCANQIQNVEVDMDKVGILVGQNSNYLMPGQELTVTAGVGAYSSATKTNISINGSPISMAAGQGEYKTTVSGAGEHSIEVNGTFTDENGKAVPVHQVVKYVVGTPGGAAVMLDKMNVFYIGVDNPVSISSGTGWDRTKVSMTGGSISPAGTPGKFIVKVSTIGKAEITVTADGKPSSYDFRVKRIPDPIIKVGPSSGGRVQSVVFKNQQFVRADLENFDFDTRFVVLSGTVFFAGAGFRGVESAPLTGGNLAGLNAQLSRCVPGSTVIFDNIKVQGPDGTPRTIQNPPGFALY